MRYKPSIDGHVRINDLIFVLTRRCNAFCDFCCNEDGPHKRGAIDPKAARDWIKEFAEYIPYCRRAGFTGGEVFLHYKELEDIHAILAEYGFVTSITTNGYWGKDIAVATQKLKRLQDHGLKGISVSIDPTHARWVPAKHSVQAVKIAIECGLKVGVMSHFWTTEGTAKDFFEPEWHPLIEWNETHYVIPVGRAVSIPLQLEPSIPTNLHCPMPQVVIQPNGDVEPCCAVALDDGVFVIGNLYEQPMSEILVEMLSDMYLKMITHRGLDELEVVVQRYHPEYNLPLRIHSVCYMCNALRKANNFWMVQDAMRSYALDLLLSAPSEYKEVAHVGTANGTA